MLNLFLKKTTTNLAKSELDFFNTIDLIDHNNNDLGENRHYPPASKEWFNSVYSYNKNWTKTLPIADETVNKLIKSYFNLNPLSNNKKSSRVQVRFKRLSLNRTMVSRAEMKHTNNKVIINIYVYNKNKNFFLYKLKNLYKSQIFKIPEKSPKLSSFVRPNTRDARPGILQKKSLPFVTDQARANRAGSRSFVFSGYADKNHKRTELRTGLVKSNTSTSLNNASVTSAASRPSAHDKVGFNFLTSKPNSRDTGRNLFRIVLINSSPSVKNKNKNKTKLPFTSKRFRDSSKGRLGQRYDRLVKINYTLNFSKLTKRNLSNFLLAINIAKKNKYAKGLKDKYKSLIKKYYFLLSNNKINQEIDNNYLNYVNIARTNSSLKNNIALLSYPIEKSSLHSVEQGENPVDFSLHSSALKKNSFFSTRLASGLAPGKEDMVTRINNNYYKLFDSEKDSFAFENVWSGYSQKFLPFASTSNTKRGFAVKKTQKRTITYTGWALYKLRNLHKLFYISPNASEIINPYEENFFDLGQEITSEIGLKKRNFLLRNLYNVLKNKKTFSALLPRRSQDDGFNFVPKVQNFNDKNLKRAKTSAKAFASKIINAPTLSLKKFNSISLKGLRILKKARKNKDLILKTLKWDNTNFRNYENKYYKNFINKSYSKEILYLYYVKLLDLNNNKFKNWFILGLKRIISKIYHKKVEFNFVNLKYLHLNSDIFSESIAIKLKNRENRLLRVLKKALKLVKLPSLSKLSFYELPSEIAHSHNSNIFEEYALNESLTSDENSLISRLNDKDVLQEQLHKIFPRWAEAYTDNSPINSQARSSFHVKNNLQENILKFTKHKNIYGVRLEATGRLSRRLTASRSVFKLKYKGSLKNINSSYKGLSTVMLRGNTRSNIQLTKISSKTRNGAFGLKGWISSN